MNRRGFFKSVLAGIMGAMCGRCIQSIPELSDTNLLPMQDRPLRPSEWLAIDEAVLRQARLRLRTWQEWQRVPADSWKDV